MAFLNIFWNFEDQRLRAFWRIISHLVMLLILVITFGAVIGIAAVVMVMATQPEVIASDPTMIGELVNTWLQSSVVGRIMDPLVQLVSQLAVLFIAGLILDRRRFSSYGFHFNLQWLLDWLFGLALGAVLMGFIFAVELAAGWVTITGTLDAAGGENFWIAIIFPLVLFFCVGISEEVLSRAYQLRNMAEGFNLKFIGPRWALLIGYFLSSSVFGFLHLGNPNTTAISTINLIVAGLFLGLGFVLTGELGIPIGLHMSWNFFQGNVFGFPVSGTQAGATFIAIQQGGPELVTGGAFGPEAGLIGLAAIALGSLLIILWVRLTRGKVGLRTDLAEYKKAVKNETQTPAASVA
ncbi:MAG TPA: CPBP family intramembrane metalloprotease [Anaerolineaceae bacterium]|nr:CPBP family intramembrane metalloprotease [Anaerolineaceae bacterium]HPN54077.1 CPBP family intramembrane metalloprotease [Anaerolineaceae bacterium]